MGDTGVRGILRGNTSSENRCYTYTYMPPLRTGHGGTAGGPLTIILFWPSIAVLLVHSPGWFICLVALLASSCLSFP